MRSFLKPLEAFGIEKRSTDGHRGECKKCRNERVREAGKRRKNPEVRAKEAARQRKRRKNPEFKAKRNAWARKRYKEDKKLRPEFRITKLLRSRLRSALKGNAKVAPTSTIGNMNLVGCTPEELKSHLDAQFLPGMSWENMGRVWHIDHIKQLRIPYKAFDMTVEEDQRIVNCGSGLLVGS